jgi:hypothetical protein
VAPAEWGPPEPSVAAATRGIAGGEYALATKWKSDKHAMARHSVYSPPHRQFAA